MRANRASRLAIAALVGTAGLLAALDLDLLNSPVDISPPIPSGGGKEPRLPEAHPPVTTLGKTTVERFAETVGRPLFHPSRRPVQRGEAAMPAEANAGPPAKLRLIGIVKVADQLPRALIRFADEPTGKWLAEGAEIRGWRLRKVNDRSVVVESGKRTHELTLPAVRSAAAPSAPQGAPRSGDAEGN